MNEPKSITRVFWYALSVSLVAVLIGAVFPESFQNATVNARGFISTNFGWYYLLLVSGIVGFCLFFMVTPYGQIRLGDPGSAPEYTTLSWYAMLFSAGMGIGLVFWGAAEPLSHYAVSAARYELRTQLALEDAFKYTFFHWGLHAWAIYGVVALALAYFGFRKKEKSLLSMTLKPIFGQRMEGSLGHFVDMMTVFATVVGVATTLGLGAIQINGGLNYLFGVEKSLFMQVIIILLTTSIFIFSALSGLGKGIKILSNVNMILAAALLALAILVGPSVLIMDTFTDSIGSYLQNFFRMSFRAAALDATHREWIDGWTIFYWAWWISWSPFVGVFIARISRGRTIREFLIGVLFMPTMIGFLWFSAFGTLSTHLESMGKEMTRFATEEVLFGTFSYYPLGSFLSFVAIFLIVTFFVTSADSATFVLGMLTSGGTLNPQNKIKVIWGLIVSFFAIILLMAGGLNAIQNASIIVAFPFSFILLLVMASLMIELKHERKEMGLKLRPQNYPTKEEPFRSYEN